jgi:predicted CopG family antitoxin
VIEKSSDPTNAAAISSKERLHFLHANIQQEKTIKESAERQMQRVETEKRKGPSVLELLERLREARRKRDEELVAKALPQKEELSATERLREARRKRDEELVAKALPQKEELSATERLREARRKRDEELVAKALPQREEQELIADQERRANLQQLLHNPVAKITEAKVFSVT